MSKILPPEGDPARTEFLALIRHAYEQQGHGIHQIAETVGVSYATARRYLTLAGARMRTPGGSSAPGHGWTDAARQKALETRKRKGNA